jgi:hypothetical protein
MSTKGKNKTPYEVKFADLIRACDRSTVDVFIVAAPEVIGDNYEELVRA